jgi:hypothetical protein
LFHWLIPPESTPQIGSAAVKRSGLSWTRPAVMMPPSEWPHAIVRAGFGSPVIPGNASSRSIWSWKASLSAQPVAL